MKVNKEIQAASFAEEESVNETDLLLPLIQRATTRGGALPSFAGVVIGQLIGIKDDGRTPLVLFPGQTGCAAVAARTVVDLHGSHIGKEVLLAFDGADPTRPIVTGLLRGTESWPWEQVPGEVEVDTDGRRVVVTAKEQLVLRCGKASLTLTKDGKVLIQGTFVSTQSSGVNRIKGGSVQIN